MDETTFAEKFEQALADRRQQEPDYGLKTLARELAQGDERQTEIIRRRLQKYRPKKPGGGAAEVAPTAPTRREIERALGLPVDALAPDEQAAAMADTFAMDLAFGIQRMVAAAIREHDRSVA